MSAIDAGAVPYPRQSISSFRSQFGNDTRRVGAELLERLQLTCEAPISTDGDSFITLRVRDRRGQPLVLKYVFTTSADAVRRLGNETRVMQRLSVRPPLRLLVPRDEGPGFVVTVHDPGQVLRAPQLRGGPMTESIATALAQFQFCQSDVSSLGVVDREHVARYYFKVLCKHIVHVWPASLGTVDALRCLATLVRSMPDILRTRAVCHGDFLPTNLLYHAHDRTVTFTDLEGVMSRNHPLFDVAAFITADETDLTGWRWQLEFVARYIEAASQHGVRLDPDSSAFARAYRAILVFVLLGRLNDVRIAAAQSAYFDGIDRRRFVIRKLASLLREGRRGWRDADHLTRRLDVHRNNLRCILSREGFRTHLTAVRAAMQAFRQGESV